MRHQRHKRSLGITKEHRKAMLNNLVQSLIKHNRIQTIISRAKEASKLMDKLITIAKRKDLHSQRLLFTYLKSRDLVKRLVNEIAPKFLDRNGGYTRIIKYRRRHGDNSLLTILEFTVLPEEKKKPVRSKKDKKDKDKDEETTKSEAPKEKEKTKKADVSAPEMKKAAKKEKASDAQEEVKDVEKDSAEGKEKPQGDKDTKEKGFMGNLRKFLKK
jgi:large subunit ribosomal protein L17